MRNQEKKTSKKTLKALLAMANFTNDVSHSSTFQTIHQDYQDMFNALMLTDDADDANFREKAFLILEFTRYFSQSFSNIDWRDAIKASEELKDVVSLKLVSHGQ